MTFSKTPCGDEFGLIDKTKRGNLGLTIPCRLVDLRHTKFHVIISHSVTLYGKGALIASPIFQNRIKLRHQICQLKININVVEINK